jgi:hypothetical protein
MTDFLNLKVSEKQVVCPKHGTHNQYISSSIEGYEGHWCMLCWLESLGPSLPVVEESLLQQFYTLIRMLTLVMNCR